MNSCKLLKKSCNNFNSAVELNLLKFDNQIDWLIDNDGKNLINFIGRFETLNEDFKTVCQKIGLPEIKLKHQNKTLHEHYCECYDKKLMEIIKQKFKQDIEAFNYEF